MESRKEIHGKNNWFPIERNKQMTAIAGTMLFILIIIELIITANLGGLISEHIFVGVLLTGPLVVKMCSTGYRFFRYYTKSPEFLKAGPPNLLLRLLAPFLVVTTILVFISGFGLVLGGQAHRGLYFKIHAASVALWLPLLAVHIYAYIRKIPSMVANNINGKPQFKVPGRKGRIGINLIILILSGIAAFIISQRKVGEHVHGLPSPLVLGIAAAVVAILVAIPLLRTTNKRL